MSVGEGKAQKHSSFSHQNLPLFYSLPIKPWNQVEMDPTCGLAFFFILLGIVSFIHSSFSSLLISSTASYQKKKVLNHKICDRYVLGFTEYPTPTSTLDRWHLSVRPCHHLYLWLPVQGDRFSIYYYTKCCGRDVELCQLIFLLSAGIFSNLSINIPLPFAYNTTIYNCWVLKFLLTREKTFEIPHIDFKWK